MKVYGSIKETKYIGTNKKPELNGLTIHFSNGSRGFSSWFSYPCETIDHAGDCYMRERGFRFGSNFQRKYFNKRYMVIVKEYYEYKESLKNGI